MAVVYATLIIKGRKTIDQVPAIIRDVRSSRF
ncbi:CD1375 family protein [Faecalibacterium prausnitzii]